MGVLSEIRIATRLHGVAVDMDGIESYLENEIFNDMHRKQVPAWLYYPVWDRHRRIDRQSIWIAEQLDELRSLERDGNQAGIIDVQVHFYGNDATNLNLLCCTPQRFASICHRMLTDALEQSLHERMIILQTLHVNAQDETRIHYHNVIMGYFKRKGLSVAIQRDAIMKTLAAKRRLIKTSVDICDYHGLPTQGFM